MRLQVKSGIGAFLVMSFTIGYCDAITFFTSGFFSGHVLANIILSVYKLFHHNTAQALLLLLTLPVYMIGVLIARQFFKLAAVKTNLFQITGIMLMVTGLLSAILIVVDMLNNQIVCSIIAFLIVVTMGVIAGAKYGLKGTTNILNCLMPGFWLRGQSLGNRDYIFLVICFLTGCISGATAGNFVGLSGVMLPGVLLFLFTIND